MSTGKSVFDSYVGFSEETVYGTGVAVTKFPDMISESIKGEYARVESAALRAGSRVLRTDRFVPYCKGASGSIKTEIADKGFGFLLKHMLGAITTTGAADPYTHTATMGSLLGKSLTVQVGRVANDGTLTPFTYTGGKVTGWQLSNAIDGVLNLDLDMDFKSENIGAGAGAFAEATPTPVAGSSLLTFVGGSVTIGGTAVNVTDATVKATNGLKMDRWFLGATQKEPLEASPRDYSWDLKAEFEGVTQINRVASATAAGALANIVLTWAAPTAGHSLTVTLTNARFDDGAVVFDGPKVTEQPISGKVLYDGAVSPVTFAYATSDPTP